MKLKRQTTQARRDLLRAQRRAGGEKERTAKARGVYLAARYALRLAIGRAKAKAWDELLAELDRDL